LPFLVAWLQTSRFAGVIIDEAPSEAGFLLLALVRARFFVVGLVASWALGRRPMVAPSIRSGCWPGYRTPRLLDLPYIIKWVRQDFVDMTAGKGQTPDRSDLGRRIRFGREIEANEFGLNPPDVFLSFPETDQRIVRELVMASVSLIGEGSVLAVVADWVPSLPSNMALLFDAGDLGPVSVLSRDFRARNCAKDRRTLRGQAAPSKFVVLNCLGDRDERDARRRRRFRRSLAKIRQ